MYRACLLSVSCVLYLKLQIILRDLIFFASCRSEAEEGDGVHHQLSEKDAAKAARKAAQVEKYMVQIRQLDDMVGALLLCVGFELWGWGVAASVQCVYSASVVVCEAKLAAGWYRCGCWTG
jgi:hypothetical protein